MPTFRRHFIFKHPLFRRTETASGVPWRESVYYLWWEFLRRHEGYRVECKQGGGGRFAKLYADFGDVHAEEFKEWWSEGDRGARLFAEPPVPVTVSRLTARDLADLPPNWDEGELMLIAVPLTLPKRFIEKKFAELLREHHTRKRGQRLIKTSRALYPIRGQFNFHSLELALRIYDLRRAEPSLKLWEIAQRLKFTTTLTDEELDKRGGAGTAKRAVMAAVVSRKLKQAAEIIEGVGKGIFPAG